MSSIWKATVLLATVLLEAWVLLLVLVIPVGGFTITVGAAVCLNLASLIQVLVVLAQWMVRQSFCWAKKTSSLRFFCLGKDYWAPIPKWEWGMDPLLRNVSNWSPEEGWTGLQTEEETIEFEDTADDGIVVTTRAHAVFGSESFQKTDENISIVEAIGTSGDDAVIDVDVEESEDSAASSLKRTSEPSSLADSNPSFYEGDDEEAPQPPLGSMEGFFLNAYEARYVQDSADASLPTMVICLPYLMASNGDNSFLFESLDYFTKVHKAPIYVMLNCRGAGGTGSAVTKKQLLVQEETSRALAHITTVVKERYTPGQIRVFFTRDSKSKAANLNAFIKVLPQKEGNEAQEEYYKYVMVYDIDDRPVFNESSMLIHAESVVGTTQCGHEIVGVQGPCLETYNDTVSGFHEAFYEYQAQIRVLQMEDYVLGRVRSQGSNHLVLTSMTRRHAFDTTCLLEDWRWSNDMLEHDNAALSLATTMVSYGQTPAGWSAVLRRRKRWYKGACQELFYDSFHRSFTKSFWLDRLYSWGQMFGFVFLMPTLHMLILFGFGAIMRETGSWTIMDPEELYDEKELPLFLAHLWNAVFLPCLGLLVLVNVAILIQSLVHVESSSFLNGRTLSWKIRTLHILAHIFSAAWFIVDMFTFNYQYKLYCHVEYTLEVLFRGKNEMNWKPTPKVSSSTTSSSIGGNTAPNQRIDDTTRTMSSTTLSNVEVQDTTTTSADDNASGVERIHNLVFDATATDGDKKHKNIVEITSTAYHHLTRAQVLMV